jgi:hypothetical protein
VSVAILVALISFLGCSVAAQGHQINLTNARLVVLPDRTVDVEIAVKGSDVDRAAGTKVFDDATGIVEPRALAAASARIAEYIEGHTAVLGEDGASCRPGAAEVAPDGDGVTVRIRWFCAAIADPLRYRSTVLVDVSPDARQLVLIGAGPDAAQDLLDASRTETTLTTAAPPSLRQVIGRYIEAGIAHIFLGYDHIAFLAAVVLWARRLWPVIKVVTAFTIAHSITLSLAALDIVRIPSSIIEPAIAASIVYVAAENFLSRKHRQALARHLRLRPDPRLRLRERLAGIRLAAKRADSGPCLVQSRRGDRADRHRLPCRSGFAGNGSPAGEQQRTGGAADDPLGVGRLCDLRRYYRLWQLLVFGSHCAFSLGAIGDVAEERPTAPVYPYISA